MPSKRKLIYVADWPYDADGRPLEFSDAELSRLLETRPPMQPPRETKRPQLHLPRREAPERPVAAV